MVQIHRGARDGRADAARRRRPQHGAGTYDYSKGTLSGYSTGVLQRGSNSKGNLRVLSGVLAGAQRILQGGVSWAYSGDSQGYSEYSEYSQGGLAMPVALAETAYSETSALPVETGFSK